MKLPALLTTAFVFALPLFPLSAETEEEAIEAANKAAQKAYVEKYNELIESGKLDPPPDELPGKPDSLERRLWMTGYYSAVMELLEPAKAEAARDPGRGHNFFSKGARGYYRRGYIAGQRATCEMANELYSKIRAQYHGELDARIGEELKKRKAAEAAPASDKEELR